MIVKVGDKYLELNEPIQVEKKVKLLDDISTVDGDFSYSFSIPSTKHNEDIIRFYNINNSDKPWNFKIAASIEDDSGIPIYLGYIRGESFSEIERAYQASFFSGNSSWIQELNFPLSEVNWSQYDRDQFAQAIIDSWSRTTGIVWPLVDRGSLNTRSSVTVFEDDFQPFIYYKDAVNAVINQAGIKLKGDILKDPIYNALITSNNGRKGYQKRIAQRSVKVGKNVPQTVNSTSYANVVLPNVTAPYYNSELSNWNTTTYRYTFDTNVKEATFNYYLKLSISTLSYAQVRILYNGTTKLYDKEYRQVKILSSGEITHDDLEVSLAGYATGDYIELQIKKTYSVFGGFDVIVGSYFEVKPVKFFTAFADALVPNITGTELLSQAFKIFNVLPSYNQITKEIDTRKFENIAQQTPIDVSEYVTIQEDNYEEFISDYAKRNLLIWDEQSSDDVTNYNESNTIPYGGGYIDIDNDFLEEQDTLIEMGFVAAFQKSYGTFGVELPAINSVSVQETTTTLSITSVTNNGGQAQFNHSAGTIGSLVRISNSTNELYNGDYRRITISGTAFVLQDLPFDTNATATATELEFIDQDNDEQVLLINNPNLLLSDYTGVDSIYFFDASANQTRMAIANFKPFDRFRGSLVFGSLEEPSSLVSKYYRTVSAMLNTGIKSFGLAFLPLNVYRSIDFLRPLFYKDSKRNVLFYPNKLTGYISSKIGSVIELIKLK